MTHSRRSPQHVLSGSHLGEERAAEVMACVRIKVVMELSLRGFLSCGRGQVRRLLNESQMLGVIVLAACKAPPRMQAMAAL